MVSWLAYRWAVHAAGAWGELVKSVSDCYLPALATQLGYMLPTGEKARWDFWENIAARFIFRQEFDDDFKPVPLPQVKPEPEAAALSVGSDERESG